MQLGVSLPYAEGGMSRAEVEEFVRAADDFGYHSVWVAEAWSFDAFMLLTSFVGLTSNLRLGTAIVNVYSRTPALIAQSVATLDALSEGRAILGLGTSGPQVIEGWHGMAFEHPLQRQRETVEIVRMILRREPLVHDGEVFHLGQRLKLINHPVRDAVPIVLASLGPRNVELTAELADGWLPVLFSPKHAEDVFGDWLAAGAARRGADLGPLEVMPSVPVAVTDTPEMARTIAKHGMALYIGGMGSREQNFYNRLFRRYGYDAEAARIQDLYLDRKRDEAVAAVTDEMVDEVSAIGPAEVVAQRLAEYEAAGVTRPIVSLLDLDQAGRLRTLEQLATIAGH